MKNLSGDPPAVFLVCCCQINWRKWIRSMCFKIQCPIRAGSL